jgi:hypothetical protein
MRRETARTERSIEDWIRIYEADPRNGRWNWETCTFWDPEKDDWREVLIERVLFVPERGILTYRFDRNLPGVLLLGKVVGDGAHWEKVAMGIARRFGCTRIRSMSRRNPEAWCKRYRAHVVEWVLEREVT